MAAKHHSGPIFSKGGFGGMKDPATGNVATAPFFMRPTPVAVATAGNVTYTGAQIINGMMVRDTAGGARTDTFPTAAQLVAAVNAAAGNNVWNNVATPNMEVAFTLYNNSGAANAITPALGTGGTAGTTAVTTAIAQNASRTFRVFITNANPGAEAYTVYA